jgi:bifunctional enzyme CysN/CysC
MSVALTLEDDMDVSRGDMICRPQNRPAVASSLEALVCWMSERPLEPGGRYAIKHTTRAARATVRELRYRIDVNELHRDRASERLELNEIGRVTLRTSAPLVFDAYRRNRSTGSFVLIDETTNDTVGAGMIIGVAAAAPEATGETGAVERSPNVVWQRGRLTREDRWSALGRRGATVWITGLPASGKSTIATALEERLVRLGVPAYLLDGDNLRHGLNGDLGFDHAARVENIRRTAHVARLLADSGAVALVSLVSPYTADRRRARSLHEEVGLDFVETWVNTPLEECERRDPKGFYAKARSGEIETFTGVSDPYEPPERPEVEIRGAEEDPIEAAERVVETLRGLGLVGD